MALLRVLLTIAICLVCLVCAEDQCNGGRLTSKLNGDGPGPTPDGCIPPHDGRAPQEAPSELVRRDTTSSASLEAPPALNNNEPVLMTIQPGQLHHRIFPKEAFIPSSSPPSHLSGTGPQKRRIRDGDMVQEDGDPLDEGLLLHEAEEAEEEKLGDEVTGRETLRHIYISLTTCDFSTPTANGSLAGNASSPQPPPPLELFVSQSPDNTRPGPGQPNTMQQHSVATSGFAGVKLNATGGDVYVGVWAPPAPASSSASGASGGEYTYELAGSVDSPYHSANHSLVGVRLVDSDMESALVATRDLTKQNSSTRAFEAWMQITEPPFTMFVYNSRDAGVIRGLELSVCGLRRHARMVSHVDNADAAVAVTPGWQVAMTKRGAGGMPKQEFYVPGLEKNSSYMAILVRVGNSTAAGRGVVGGGGKVWKAMNFSTKADGNCKLIYNLSFCNDSAYAVPYSPNVALPGRRAEDRANATALSKMAELAQFYDDMASQRYKNFSSALSLVACNTTPSARYSLASTCDDCRAAYKAWLCAVTIPRCDDFSARTPFRKARNIAQPFFNGSRFDPADAGNLSLIFNGSVGLNATRSSSSLSSLWSPTLEPDNGIGGGGGGGRINNASGGGGGGGGERLISIAQQLLQTQQLLQMPATNASRNPPIDAVLRPGPYKEVLPCLDLCHEMLRRCPAALGFACPPLRSPLRAKSYGLRGRERHELVAEDFDGDGVRDTEDLPDPRDSSEQSWRDEVLDEIRRGQQAAAAAAAAAASLPTLNNGDGGGVALTPLTCNYPGAYALDFTSGAASLSSSFFSSSSSSSLRGFCLTLFRSFSSSTLLPETMFTALRTSVTSYHITFLLAPLLLHLFLFR